MATRKSLVRGIQDRTSIDPVIEKSFIHGSSPTVPPKPQETATPQLISEPRRGEFVSRAPISTRIRADFAKALKRASLERQLAGQHPYLLQDILEEALQPWLRANGYLN